MCLKKDSELTEKNKTYYATDPPDSSLLPNIHMSQHPAGVNSEDGRIISQISMLKSMLSHQKIRLRGTFVATRSHTGYVDLQGTKSSDSTGLGKNYIAEGQNVVNYIIGSETVVPFAYIGSRNHPLNILEAAQISLS